MKEMKKKKNEKTDFAVTGRFGSCLGCISASFKEIMYLSVLWLMVCRGGSSIVGALFPLLFLSFLLFRLQQTTKKMLLVLDDNHKRDLQPIAQFPPQGFPPHPFLFPFCSWILS
jgi:hypothetical protein